MDEQLKQPLMIGVIAAALSVTVYELYYWFTLERGTPATITGTSLGLLVGLVVGGIAFGVAFAMLRNKT
jgi:hypothetical protein